MAIGIFKIHVYHVWGVNQKCLSPQTLTRSETKVTEKKTPLDESHIDCRDPSRGTTTGQRANFLTS